MNVFAVKDVEALRCLAISWFDNFNFIFALAIVANVCIWNTLESIRTRRVRFVGSKL